MAVRSWLDPNEFSALAEKVDLNICNVQRIEAGEINILITTAKRIKNALGCSWDNLMEK